MTNDQAGMTNDRAGMTNHQTRMTNECPIPNLGLSIHLSFGRGYWDLLLGLVNVRLQFRQKLIQRRRGIMLRVVTLVDQREILLQRRGGEMPHHFLAAAARKVVVILRPEVFVAFGMFLEP